ncbi:hypothetical protein D3C76_744030 [compost metagenome]
MVIAQLEGVELLRVRLHLTHKTQRQADLRVGNGRCQARFAQNPVPGVQVLFAAIDDADLPDQQHLRGVLQMSFVRAFQIADKLTACGFAKLVNHRLQRYRRNPQALAEAFDRAARIGRQDAKSDNKHHNQGGQHYPDHALSLM